jgi:hypothetical protein
MSKNLIVTAALFALTFESAEELENAQAILEGGTPAGSKPAGKKLHVPSKKELKDTLTELREEAGSETLKDLLKTHGAKNLATLDEDEWPGIYAAAKNILDEDDGLGDDDDDLDMDDDDDDLGGADADVDPEEVKAAVQKYAKANGRDEATDILKENGLNSVRGLKGATTEQRAKIYRAVTK